MPKKITKATDKILQENEIDTSKSSKNEEQMTALGYTAWKYRLQGYSYHEIGRMMSIGTAKIKNYIQRIQDDYRMEIWADQEEFREILSYRLMHMAKETQLLWDEAKSSGDLTPMHVSYLESSRKMIKDVRDMMGLDAPKRTESEVTTIGTPYTVSLHLDGSSKPEKDGVNG